LILQLLLGHFALRRLLRTARPLPEWARLVSDRLISQAGLPVLVQASDRVRSPICFGFFQPVVLIPKSLVQVGTVAELKWILAHEFDHVRRRDHRMVWWVGLARAVFFFIPWFWAVRRELALAQEYLADQAAVAADGRPVDYAAFLVQLTTDMAGTRCDRPPLAASGVQAGRSDLFRRVNMVLQNRSQFPRRFSRLGAAVTASSVLGLATVISGLGWANAQEPAPPREAPRIPAPAVPSVKELKDALNQALKKGDEPEIRRLFDALEKALTEKPKPVERPLEVPKDRLIERPTPAPQPPEPPMPPRRERPRDPQPPAEAPRQPNVPGEGRFVPRDQFVPAPNDLREQFDRQLRSFEDMIRRMENGESRQQLEKARDEFKKAMEEGLKQADAVREKLRDKGLVPRIIVGGADFFPPADFNFMPFPAEGFAFNRGAIAGFPMVQPRLGVGVEKPSPTLVEQLDLPKEGGLVIASVRNESPAAKAGLKTNDILVQFAGKDVPADPARFQEVVAGLNASEKYDAVVIRKGKKETVKGIELPEPGRRPGFDFPALGKMEISINGKDVSIKATEGEVKYTLVGELQNGRLKPNSISIQDGQETIEATSLEKLPRKYQPKVQQMFDSAQRLGGGGAPGFPGGGAGGGFGGGRGGAPGLPGGGAGGGRGGAPGQPGEGPARNPGGR
jgi:exonuclease VII small subunit